MVRLDKSLVIAGMDNILQSYYLKGKKNYSILMPVEICGIAKMDLARINNAQNIIVALKNG